MQIIHEGTVVFTDAQGCAIPEGCLYRPGEIHPWIFHLPPLEAGDYTALMTLMGIVDCSGVCKPVFSGGTTIGLTFTVLSK
ncbi:MAG TPA: hypothetical protein VFE98_08560 [Candidatus Bathyarchaeia archaeon]|nr:hypothetical protein [Candidatus Bathyarchaeia archaeon]